MDTDLQRVQEQLILALEVVRDKKLLPSNYTIHHIKEPSRVTDNGAMRLQGQAVFINENEGYVVVYFNVLILFGKCEHSRIEFDKYILMISLLEEDSLDYLVDLHKRGENLNSKFKLIETMKYDLVEVLLKNKIGVNESKLLKNSNIF